MALNIAEMVKQRSEQQAAAADPAAKPDAKQILSSAATNEGQQLVDAAQAVEAGAQSKTRISDTAQDIRQPNSELPVASQVQVLESQKPWVSIEQQLKIDELAAKMKTFKHVYAGATVYMPNGDKIQFGGGVGGAGYFATDKPEEIEYLTGIAEQHGSQVTVVGKEKESHEQEFREDMSEAANVARENTARFQNPQTLKAFDNLGAQIANNG